MFDTGAHLLLRHDLVDCLKRAGVDTFDAYSAELRDKATRTTHLNYAAVNIFGLVSAVDSRKSKGAVNFGLGQGGEGTLLFDNVVLDPKAGFDRLDFD